MSADDARVARVIDAVMGAIDRRKLAEALPREEARAMASGARTPLEAQLAERLVLADLLDDTILGARPGEPSFALRSLMGELSAALGEDDGFALAIALNAFFRSEGDEETRMRIGLDASRLYYRFAQARGMTRETVAATSPLLAQLMSTQLPRVRLESVDHQRVFDSSVHEREAGSRADGATIERPASFACRVASNGVVRVKASVIT